MLKFEDSVVNSDLGNSIFNYDSYEHFTCQEAMNCIHRHVLNNFGFSNKDDDIFNYRQIFSNYYKSQFDYDKDVISLFTCIKENKFVH